MLEPGFKPGQRIHADATQYFGMALRERTARNLNVLNDEFVRCEHRGESTIAGSGLAQQLEIAPQAFIDGFATHVLKIDRNLDARHIEPDGGFWRVPAPGIRREDV